MENEKLFLALRAGARAIVSNKRLHGAIYCFDIWGENGGPKEISYLEAAILLAETADKMEGRPLSDDALDGVSVSCIAHFANEKVGPRIEWDDDIDLNYTDSTTEQWERYFEEGWHETADILE